MRKTVLVVLVLILAFSALPTFAAAPGLGIGIEFGMDLLGGLPQPMLTLKLNNLPFVLGVGVQIGDNAFNMGVMLDWWLFQTHLIGVLDLYIGPGLYLTLPGYVEFGGRIPIGLQIWPIGKVFELFLELAPSMYFYRPEQIQIPNLGLQAGVGFRFWF